MPSSSRATSADTARAWVLISAVFDKTGGQDRANCALASYLARQRHETHLVGHRISPELSRAATVVPHAVPRPLRSDLLGEPFLRHLGTRWAARLSPSPHVIVNGGNCSWPDVNWVHYVHAAYDRTDVEGTARRLRMRVSHWHWLRDEREALRRARLIIANSDRTRRDLIERVGVTGDRIRVVYYGIDPERFRPATAEERAATRADVGWHDDRHVWLFIGALGDRRKGFDRLIEAWRIIAARSRRRPPLLAVIGQGAMLGRWRHYVASNGLSECVSFLGFRHDVPRLARAADGLVAPTRYEAYGLGVHEALCCGLPALVSASAGVAERYPEALRGLLISDIEDSDALAEQIDSCQSNLTALAAATSRFAESLRSRTWDHMAREIVTLVQTA